MVIFIALCALLAAAPASAAVFNYDFNAVWLDGDAIWERNGLKRYFETERAGFVTFDDAQRWSGDCAIGDFVTCDWVRALEYGTNGSVTASLVDYRYIQTMTLTPEGGVFEFTCDCTWNEIPGDLGSTFHDQASYRLALTPVPIPPAGLMLAAAIGLLGLGRRSATRHATG